MSRRGRERIKKEQSSPESESNRSISNVVRKQTRAPRTVDNLTASQLEKKRQHDREAQRSIRQRTKDKISDLETEVCELRAKGGPESQLVEALQQRLVESENENRRLIFENDCLRSRLRQAGMPSSPAEEAGPWEHSPSSWLPPPVPPLQHQAPTSHLSSRDVKTTERSRDRRGSHEQASSYAYNPVQTWPRESEYHRELPEGGELSASDNTTIGSTQFETWTPQTGGTDVAASIGCHLPLPVTTQPYSGSGALTQSYYPTQLPMHPHNISPYEQTRQAYFQRPHQQPELPHNDPSVQGGSQAPEESHQTYYGRYPPSS